MLHSYFPTYEVEEPETHATKILGPGSYFAAGAFGSFYVLFKGFVVRFVVALAIDAVCVVLAAAWAVLLNDYVGSEDMIIPLFVGAVGLCVARSIPIVILVRNGYRSRGWAINRS